MYSHLPSITGGRSSICNLRTRHAVVTGTHLTRILGEIRTKNSFGLKSKVPFIIDRLEPNFHYLLPMRSGYSVVLLSDPTAILREIRTKNCFDLKSKAPFITDRHEPNLYCFCEGSTMCYYSVTPRQSWGRYGRKTVSTSRAKHPSVLSDFNLRGTENSAPVGSTWCYSVTPLQT
jgi:hypothetical protein